MSVRFEYILNVTILSWLRLILKIVVFCMIFIKCSPLISILIILLIAFRVKSIVPKDTYLCDAFYFKAPLDIEEIPIKWILLSRYHNCEGELKIEIQPEFEYKAIHDDEKAGKEIIEDYITLNDNDTD